jgi:hypothetical protein
MTKETEYFSWLIEAPDASYLALRQNGKHPEFFWVPDKARALRFFCYKEAFGSMLDIQALFPELWTFTGKAKIIQQIEVGRPGEPGVVQTVEYRKKEK